MTATPDQTATFEPFPVFLWFGQPDIGREELLMVMTNDPTHGVVSRPLMSLDAETAASQQNIAQAAANALKVKAVLREYRFESIVDRLTPEARS